MIRLKEVAIATAAVAVLGVVGVKTFDEPYQVDLLMPSAGETFEGAQVNIGGEQVGSVKKVGVKDGQALVTIEVKDKFAPLKAGTTGRITWEAVLGARIVELVPGPSKAPDLDSGKMITPNVESVSIDNLLATLDAPTRKNLQKLLDQLNSTVGGKEPELNKTITDAGPTVEAIGSLLSAVGNDGPAIKRIVTQLSTVAETVGNRDGEVSASLVQLNQLVAELAKREEALARTIDQLPGTLDQATSTLNAVPGPVKSTRGLLRDLQPTTSRLPGISQNLRPLLRDARQPIADLTPLLNDADELLTYTPSLLRNANRTLPDLTASVKKANPMVDFLRGYTPELASWASNWGSVFASQNGAGNYARALITASSTSATNTPTDTTDLPAGQCAKSRPQPGDLANTGKSYNECRAIADANGDGVR